MDKVLYVISHTHWDREWYQTYQQFRVRLVKFIDDLLDVLENDPSFKCFHFDGQTILIEDYLEIRPKNKERLNRLIIDGRIVIGPWYVMPDEFLVSGESLIRNMQLGMEICKDIGVKPLMNGYIVDIFGHNSQFPQFLNGFGIKTAVLYRGIGDYEKDTFIWQGADDSEVLTAKLDKNRAYSNLYFTARWPFDNREFDDDEIVSRVEKLLEYNDSSAVSNTSLLMDGVDHIDVEPEMPRILKMLESRIKGTKFIHSNLEDYFEAQRQAATFLETIKGTLYHVGKNGLNNLLLKNVLSSMVHLKQANDDSEIALTRWAEPLDFVTGMLSDLIIKDKKKKTMEPRSDFLKQAWKLLIQNQPHDSICGCSIYDVHADNEYRFRQVRDICLSVTQDAKEEISGSICTLGTGQEGAVIFFNAGQKAYKGIHIFELNVTQEHQYNFKFYDKDGLETPYQIIDVHSVLEKKVALRELINFTKKDHIRIAMDIKVEPCGYSTYTYDSFCTQWPQATDYTYVSYCEPTRYLGSLRTGINTFDTGKIEVTINTNGTLKVKLKETGKIYDGLLTFEDTGDCGDGWNYRKPMMDSALFSICRDADFSVEADGPFATIIKITNYMKIPACLDVVCSNVRSKDLASFEIVNLVTLKKDSTRLEIDTIVDNKVMDHRLRVLLPTELNTSTFYTKTPFDMEKWNIKKEDWSNFNEIETNVNPSQGITLITDSNDSVMLFTKGLYEVEVMDNKSTAIALTLFRTFSTEVNSKSNNDAYMKRLMNFYYAIDFGADTTPEEAMIIGEDYRCGISALTANNHAGTLPSSLSFAKIDENSKVVLSSITRDSLLIGNQNASTIRLFNVSNNIEDGTITFPKNINKAWYVDFRGNVISEALVCANQINYKIDIKKIITIAFNFKK